MANIDLHTHSTCSDGTYTPAELVSYAQQKGLSAIALTDHDTIDGLEEARNQAERLGIRLIDGIEISSFYYMDHKRVNIHVLGYSFHPDQMKPYTLKLKLLRLEHNESIRKALHAVGVEIQDIDLQEQGKTKTITRLHFAKALVAKGYVESVDEALRKYLHKGGSAYVEYDAPSFQTVAEQIHNAGGIVSLAHPAEYGLSDRNTEALIQSLLEFGLDAVECIHPSQDSIYANALMNLAKKYHLRMTGGSDFHGEHDEKKDLGLGGDEMLIPETFLTEIER